MTDYKVTCQKCEGFAKLTITPQNQIIWDEIKGVVSGRLRLDNQWGWQCICGNNSIMTKQEIRMMENPAQATKQEINNILKDVKAEQVVDTPDGLLVNKFIMQRI